MIQTSKCHEKRLKPRHFPEKCLLENISSPEPEMTKVAKFSIGVSTVSIYNKSTRPLCFRQLVHKAEVMNMIIRLFTKNKNIHMLAKYHRECEEKKKKSK